MESPAAGDPWRELDMAPTIDRRAIRHAYAARLKRLDPARDPSAFARLRAAYEAALRGSRRQPPDSSTIENTPPVPRAPEIAEAIRALLREGEADAAFASLQRADAAHMLAIGATGDLEREFLAAAVSTRTSPATVLALARRFDWERAASPLRKTRPDLFAKLDRRLDAEHWYAGLRQRAERRPGWPDAPEEFVARLLLRGRPRWRETLGVADWRLMLGTPLHHLCAELRHLERHREWVGERFDAARIRWCRRRIFPGRVTLLYLLVIGAVAPVTEIMQRLGMRPVEGRFNIVLWTAVAICAGVWLSHRRNAD